VSGFRGQRWFAVAALGLLSGCAGNVGSMVAGLDERREPVELQDVPFHSQVTDQCGPAALATVLNDAGIAVTPEELRSRVYIPGRQGSLQVEILATARYFGRITYEIDPTLTALVAELDAGRPVLVLQNLGASIAPLWHYAVVVGFLPDEDKIVLRSGDRQRLLTSPKKFARSWLRGDYWGFVTLEPGELPALPDADRYLRAVAAAEATLPAAGVSASYRAATQRWPQNSLAWLGLGNAAYVQGELQVAEQAYLEALSIDVDDAVAMNNLAQVYVDKGCHGKALATIDAALAAVAEGDPVRSHLLRTRDGITQSDAGSRCQ
jgi:hypothetical protein